MNQKNTQKASSYYAQDYFDRQKNVGAFGGIANSFKFTNSYKLSDTVLDFGCGGGFLLANLDCKRKICIVPNNSVVEPGFTVINSRPYYHHKWLPHYQYIACFGWPLFHLACKVYARLERKWFQVEIIAKK